MSDVVYSPDRAKQLRFVLWAVVALGAVMAALAGYLAATGRPGFTIVIGIPAALLLVSAALTLRQLRGRGRRAKIMAVVTGALLILIGLWLANSALGVLPTILGVLLVLLALLADHGEHEGRGCRTGH